MSETSKSFTADEARMIGKEIGIDWATAPFDVEQLRTGMKVELEHGLHDPLTNVSDDDPHVTAKIAALVELFDEARVDEVLGLGGFRFRVLEGELVCGERRREGPFGEFPGYYTRLERMEEEAKHEWAERSGTKSFRDSFRQDSSTSSPSLIQCTASRHFPSLAHNGRTSLCLRCRPRASRDRVARRAARLRPEPRSPRR